VFDPFPGGLGARYQFDLARNFFPTLAAEEAARNELIAAARRLGAARDSVSAAMRASAAGLEEALAIADSLRRLAGKHYAYHSLRSFVDVRIDFSAGAQPIANALGRDLAFVNDVIATLPDSTVARWSVRSQSIARWRFYIEQVRHDAMRAARNPSQFAAANAAAQRLTGWQVPAFQGLLRIIEYPLVTTPEGPKDVRAEGPLLMNHSSRDVREQWYRSNRAGMTSKRDTFAAILTSTINGRNEVARMRGFADFRDESYNARFLTPRSVRELLTRIAASSAINKRYERMRVDRLRSQHGFDTVHTWDLVLPERGMTTPQLTITEASRVMTAALQPFGAEYGRELAALLDPANGRLDLVPRPNRSDRQGFSTGTVGYPSTFFQGRYAGYIEDVITFVHEGGHAVQNMLMDRARVPFAYAVGADFFTESFAGVNELLVTDYLFRTATDRPQRIYYLQRFLDQATDLFRSAREALVEDEFYATVTPSKPGTADAFEASMQRIGGSFSLWFGAGSERPMEWVNAIHFFTRPLYRVNYMYAKLLALNYFAQMEADPKVFPAKFTALLSNGYDARPNDILQRFVGLSLDDPRLVDRAMDVISGRLEILRNLYSQ
jgi:oligoendopeptidase F